MDWSGTIQPMGAPEGADVRFVNVWYENQKNVKYEGIVFVVFFLCKGEGGG